MRKRIFLVLSVLGLSLGSVAVATTPAQAAWSDCWSNHVCFFDGIGGGNPIVGDYTTYYQSQGCVNFPSASNDRAASVYNRWSSGWYIKVFSGYNCYEETINGLFCQAIRVDSGQQHNFAIDQHGLCGIRDRVSSFQAYYSP